MTSIAELVRELADYERAADSVKFRPEDLHHHLFGPDPAARVLLAEVTAGQVSLGDASVVPDSDSEQDDHSAARGRHRGSGRQVIAGGEPEARHGDRTVAGMALWFRTFSTWEGQPGIWLEDLFVRPAFRRAGIGRALIEELQKRTDGRLEWSVLDWNQPAIDFYRSLGAEPLSEWTIFRLPARRRDDH